MKKPTNQNDIETLKVGKWIVRAHHYDARGIIISFSRPSDHTDVAMWRSPTNWTAEVVTNLGSFCLVPKTARRAGYAMLAKYEKIIEKATAMAIAKAREKGRRT